MSAFIVISTSDLLNWIVDGIEKCRPKNPNTITHIALGKILREDDGIYYQSTYSIESEKTKEEANYLKTLLANQIAQFRKKCNLDDELQIFTLENPIDDERFNYANYVYAELTKVINERHEMNCRITRILFSYDITDPCNVCKQVYRHFLQEYIKLEQSSLYQTQICYIDNQNRNCAAISTKRENHDLMLPRMLADLMMLISCGNSAYNIRNAILNDTCVFSVGYAECTYFYEDIIKYYTNAYQIAIRQQILNSQNEETSLDYKTKPLGISSRVKRLHSIYRNVPFTENINNDIFSHDRKIDDIIVSLREYIEGIKNNALEKAKEEDEILTIKRKEQAISSGEEQSVIDAICITTNQEKVKREYPDYIDRTEIFNIWRLKSEKGKSFDDIVDCKTRRESYEKLLSFIQTPKFKGELNNYYAVDPINSSQEQKSVINYEGRSGCNLFARWFKRSQELVEIEENSRTTNCAFDKEKIIDSILSIPSLQKEKELYKELCIFENKINNELNDLLIKIKTFVLTQHDASFESLIDLSILTKTQQSSIKDHIENILVKWNSLSEDEKNLDTLYRETTKECELELENYKYINWDSPAFFIKKDINIEWLSHELEKRSNPWVCTQTHRAMRENLTSKYFYFDREEWQEKINDQKIQLPIDTIGQLSSHIESKYAIFQILKWDADIIKGLTDMVECDVN